jgi:hypothetical protein
MASESREVMPSRVLNDQRGIFGLWMSDFGAAVAVFMGGSWVLDGTRYQLLSIPAALFVLLVLIPIRLSTRRKIVRDYLRRGLTSEVLYDPSTRVSS